MKDTIDLVNQNDSQTQKDNHVDEFNEKNQDAHDNTYQ